MAKCICSREVFEGETKFFKWFNYGISRNVEKGEYNFGMPLLEVIAAVLSQNVHAVLIHSLVQLR